MGTRQFLSAFKIPHVMSDITPYVPIAGPRSWTIGRPVLWPDGIKGL